MRSTWRGGAYMSAKIPRIWSSPGAACVALPSPWAACGATRGGSTAWRCRSTRPRMGPGWRPGSTIGVVYVGSLSSMTVILYPLTSTTTPHTLTRSITRSLCPRAWPLAGPPSRGRGPRLTSWQRQSPPWTSPPAPPPPPSWPLAWRAAPPASGSPMRCNHSSTPLHSTPGDAPLLLAPRGVWGGAGGGDVGTGRPGAHCYCGLGGGGVEEEKEEREGEMWVLDVQGLTVTVA